MAPLQKRAWWGLGLGLAFTAAFVLVFVLMGGIETFDTNQTFRIIINVIWIGALLTHLVIMDFTLRKPRMVDERDRMIRDIPKMITRMFSTGQPAGKYNVQIGASAVD